MNDSLLSAHLPNGRPSTVNCGGGNKILIIGAGKDYYYLPHYADC